MNTRGKHLLVEYRGCDAGRLNDLEHLKRAMIAAAESAGATVVGSLFHPFCPQGLSGVVVVEESHLSIHTWPETGYAAVDFYTCGDCEPEKAHAVLSEALLPTSHEMLVVERGLENSVTPGGLQASGLQVAKHAIDGRGLPSLATKGDGQPDWPVAVAG